VVLGSWVGWWWADPVASLAIVVVAIRGSRLTRLRVHTYLEIRESRFRGIDISLGERGQSVLEDMK
jgi:divalent metal cation (Fe/Co/Zn/Cd) transporter